MKVWEFNLLIENRAKVSGVTVSLYYTLSIIAVSEPQA